uniref:Dispatched RND transporter family member 2 n=1 Tax=Rhinopithecus bieti TaxID=61621 RepID=A0A2K6KTT4_RHIBE
MDGDSSSSGGGSGPAPGSGPEGEQRPEGEPLAPDGGSPDSTQTKAVAPEASPERSCSLHSCPLEEPSSSSGPPPTTSTLQPVGPSSPLAPAHFTYPRALQEYQGGSSLPGLGDRAALCSHGSSLSPSPAPSQRDGTWKPPAVQHHVVSVRQERAFQMPKSYSQLIAEWPVAVLMLCLAAIFLCTLAGLLGARLPDFSKPLLGFEPRDTDIGSKLVVWRALQALTGPRKLLFLSPDLELNSSSSHNTLRPAPRGSAQESIVRPRRMVEPLEDRRQENFFCGPPEKSYAKLVFMSTSSGSLWNLHAIHSMCRMEQDQIRSHTSFGALCQRTAANQCCPSWSLGNYLAVLSNRSSCLDTTQADAARTLALLRTCALYYHSGALVPSCLGPGKNKSPRCAQVPTKCSQSSAIYQLLHFLLDRDFLSPQTTDYQVPSLKYSLLFLPTPKGASLMDIYLDRLATPWGLADNYTSVTGMDLGLKQELLRYFLVQDTVYPLLALAAIFFGIALYLRSLFLTLMVLLGVLGSLLVAFFLYQVAFRMAYFPFVNLAALLLLSSVCANHTLIFFDLWRLSKSQLPSGGLAQRVGRTMHHFGYLLLVSGLTTSAAFYASYLSRLPAVRCLALFMGTAVLVHLALTLVWLARPAVLHGALLRRAAVCAGRGPVGGQPPRGCCCAHRPVRGLAEAAAGTSRCSSHPPAAAHAAAPGGRSSGPGHPFERFDAEYRQLFLFEQAAAGRGATMAVVLVWGVLPVDTGDPLDPRSNSSLVRDPAFSASALRAQRGLLCSLPPGPGIRGFFDTLQEAGPRCVSWRTSMPLDGRAPAAKGPDGTRTWGLPLLMPMAAAPGSSTGWAAELGMAPPGLRRGWFTSRLELYSLQHKPEHEPAVVLALLLDWPLPHCCGHLECSPQAYSPVAAVAGTLLRVASLCAQTSCATQWGLQPCFAAGVLMLPATVLLLSCGCRFFFQSLCCFSGQRRTVGRYLWPCAHLPWDAGTGDPWWGERRRTTRISWRDGRTCSEQYGATAPGTRRQPQLDPAQPPSKLVHRPSGTALRICSSMWSLLFPPPPAPASPRGALLDHQAVFQAVPCPPVLSGQPMGSGTTLWLAQCIDPSLPASHQSSLSWKGRGGPGDGSPVVLPNSQPDLPDVWLRRPSTHTSGYSS